MKSSSQLLSASQPSLGTSDHDVSQQLDQPTTTAVNPLISTEPEPPLHPEQEAVVQAIMQGYNVFYTGSAGVGKSTVLKNFVKGLERQNKKIDIVAPSGIAVRILLIGESKTLAIRVNYHPASRYQDRIRDMLTLFSLEFRRSTSVA